MTEIRPFRGYSYNQDKLSNLSSLVAPPYDVITEEERKILADRSPFNFIHLTLPKYYNPNNSTDIFYQEASLRWQKWKSDGFVTRSNSPEIFCLKETYHTEEANTLTRFGFIAELSLSSDSDHYVLRHEKTHKAPKMDRVKLYKSTKANLSPLFFIYKDDVEETKEFLEHFKSLQKKQASLSHRGNVKLELSSTSESSFIESYCKSFREKHVLIADGHHRYEASKILHKKNVDKSLDTSAVMAYLVPTSSQGLIVHPTHRGVHNFCGYDEILFLKSLQEKFYINPISEPIQGGIQILTKNKGRFTAIPKKKTIQSLMNLLPQKELAEIPVVILEEVIFKKLLGMTNEDISAKENIHYFQDTKNGIDSVSSGEWNAAFFLDAISLDDLFRVTLAGGLLPQKSTYFYPKVTTGMIVRPMDK